MAEDAQEVPVAESPKPATPRSVAKKRKRVRSKAATGKAVAAKKGAVSKPPKAKAPRPFPKVTLEDALVVALKIKELNGGNPWATAEVAKAVEMGARSPNFYYLTAASRDFGLTTGTRETPKIELTDLGRQIVYAPNADAEHAKKVEAFLRIEVFKRVLEHYKGSALPDMKYLGNTLEREFGISPEFHEEFAQLFRLNCKQLGIEQGAESTSTTNGARPERSATTIVLGEPKGAKGSGLKAFVIMPFVERNNDYPKGFFGEVLRSLITPAALEAGFVVETANKQGSDIIQSTIINDLLEADLVIADLTAHNPNVLFELGVRMAEDRPVALIKATGTGRIFDVDNMLRVLEYNSNLWQSTIEADLPVMRDHIRAAWDNRDSNQSYMKILRRGVAQSV